LSPLTHLNFTCCLKTAEIRRNQPLSYTAVTGGTLSSHQSHTITWDASDISGNIVPDGRKMTSGTTNGESRIIIQLKDLQSGNYILKLTGPLKERVIQFMKQ